MLIWPDTSIVRFFYQNNLHKRQGAGFKVIEFGCGSAANLKPFIEAGWQVYGVDMNLAAKLLESGEDKRKFITHDLNLPLPEEIHDLHFDVILFPQILCYLSPTSRENLLTWTANHLKEKGLWLLTERTLDDYRAVHTQLSVTDEGAQIGTINFRETNEFGLTVIFWPKEALLNNLTRIFASPESKITIFESFFENMSNGKIIQNSDLLVWGGN